MSRRRVTSRLGARSMAAVAAVGCGAALAGCGSSAGLSTGAAASANGPAATTNAAASPGTSSMAAMPGMKLSSGKAVDGIKPIPTQVLGTADWQNMQIKAQAMTAVPFVIYNGSKEREVKPPTKVSFHLMVDLTDARSHWPIPYASVWATIRKGKKVVFDEPDD